MMRYVILFLLLILVSCTSQPTEKIVENKEEMAIVNLVTDDGINLKAIFFEANHDKGVILLPMLNRDKSSYDPLIPTLLENNYTVLALDLRGHGESDLSWKSFMELTS